MSHTVVTGSFDNLRLRDMRFLEEAAKFGLLHVLLRSDSVARAVEDRELRFPRAERQYFLESIRYVDLVTLIEEVGDIDCLPVEHVASASAWVVDEASASLAKEEFCRAHNLQYCILREHQLQGFPYADRPGRTESAARKKKVVVTGSYDWLHSGHVRFFEEVSALGELHVVVGHDANIHLLKGVSHPMYSEDERRYMAGSIRFVNRAYISSGDGWLDAEPEIERIHPDIYAVNEDGDRPEKRDYCQAHGIDYRVLQRRPKPGLEKRQSTDLRGY